MVLVQILDKILGIMALIALQVRREIPTLVCKAIAFRHLFIWSPDIIEMRSVDAIALCFFIDRRSYFLYRCDRALLFLLIGDRSFADKARITYNRC